MLGSAIRQHFICKRDAVSSAAFHARGWHNPCKSRTLAEGRRVALICATGVRSGSIMCSLRLAGYGGFIDVSEGMLGSARGPGWIATGLPVVNIESAISALPKSLV